MCWLNCRTAPRGPRGRTIIDGRSIVSFPAWKSWGRTETRCRWCRAASPSKLYIATDVALSRQVEIIQVQALKERDQGELRPGRGQAFVFLGVHNDDGWAAADGDRLGPLITGAAHQFAETRLGVLTLPVGWLCGFADIVTRLGVADFLTS